MNRFAQKRLCRGFLAAAFLACVAVSVAQEAKPTDEQRPPIPITEVKQAAPVDFENASPFPRRTKDRDPIRTGIMVAAIVALLAFIGSMIAVLAMHPPVL